MKIQLILVSFLLILSACGKNNTTDVASTKENKAASTDAKIVVENFKKLLKQHQTKGVEDWISIISPDLIFIGVIETNRSQADRVGMWRCNLVTKLVRLSDGKTLEYRDVFNVQVGTVADEIMQWFKKAENLDRDQVINSLKDLSFMNFTREEFTLIDDRETWMNCDTPLVDAMPLHVIEKYMTKWMLDQINKKVE
jgi:hypothetical protein